MRSRTTDTSAEARQRDLAAGDRQFLLGACVLFGGIGGGIVSEVLFGAGCLFGLLLGGAIEGYCSLLERQGGSR